MASVAISDVLPESLCRVEKLLIAAGEDHVVDNTIAAGSVNCHAYFSWVVIG